MPEPAVTPSRDASALKPFAEVLLCLGLVAGIVVLLAVDPGEPHEPMGSEVGGIEGVLLALVHWVATGAEIAAAVVIAWGAGQAFVTYVLKVVQPGAVAVNSTETLRIRLGRTLALGLEFTVASDILKAGVAPNRGEIILLVIIILVRTLLNIFLDREIESLEARNGGEEMVPMDAGEAVPAG